MSGVRFLSEIRVTYPRRPNVSKYCAGNRPGSLKPAYIYIYSSVYVRVLNVSLVYVAFAEMYISVIRFKTRRGQRCLEIRSDK